MSLLHTLTFRLHALLKLYYKIPLGMKFGWKYLRFDVRRISECFNPANMLYLPVLAWSKFLFGGGGQTPPPKSPLSFETQDTLFLFSAAHCQCVSLDHVAVICVILA